MPSATSPLTETIVTDIGPVVGTHTDAGCVGCAVYQPRDDEERDLIAPLEPLKPLETGSSLLEVAQGT